MDAYRNYCKKKNLEPAIVELDAGARGAWIGNAKAKQVILFIHGFRGPFFFPFFLSFLCFFLPLSLSLALSLSSPPCS
jgi:hypothetical protein